MNLRLRTYNFEPMHVVHGCKKINLGCGRDIREGFVNVDKFPGEGVDRIIDVERDLLRGFKSDTFGYVFARDFLNHLPHRSMHMEGEFWDLFISDLIRISEKGAIWEFIHPCRPASLENGGHCRIVGLGSFNYWLMGKEMNSLEAQNVDGSLRVLAKHNIRAWPNPRAVFWDIVFEVVK